MFRKKSSPRNRPQSSRLRVYSAYKQPQKSPQRPMETTLTTLRRPRSNEATEPRRRLPGKWALWIVPFGVLLFFTHISVIDVHSTGKLDQATSDKIGNEARAYLHARPWRNFQLFISSKDLADALQRSDPAISELEVKRSLLSKRVSLTLQARQVAAVWQQGRGGQRYFVDESGLVLAPEDKPAKLPLILSDPSPTSGQVIGQRVLESSTVKTAKTWAVKLSDMKLAADFFLVTTAPRQVSVALTGKPYQLILSTSTPVDETVKALQDTTKLLNDRHESPGSYIDLRIPYRVFYK